MTELETLQKAAIETLRHQRPKNPPLVFSLGPLMYWCEARLVALIRDDGFPEARRAFNPVFIHLPADGCRLTELAARAGMSKQAMAEVVDELVTLGYLVRFPDPSDGRAKLIVRSEKGLQAHYGTMRAFGEIEEELGDLIGQVNLQALQRSLRDALDAVNAADQATDQRAAR